MVETYGALILINNAALVSETLYPPMGHRPTLETTDEDWAEMFAVNVFGTVKITRRFIEPMREQRPRKHHQRGKQRPADPVQRRRLLLGPPVHRRNALSGNQSRSRHLRLLSRRRGAARWRSVNSLMPGHTRASWFDDTAHAHDRAGQVYFFRPVVSEHVLPITLFLSAQDGQKR